MNPNRNFPWLELTVVIETVLCGFFASGWMEARKREERAEMKSLDRGQVLLAMPRQMEERSR